MLHQFPFHRLLFLILALECGMVAFQWSRAGDWTDFLVGDCPLYAACAQSLAEDADWDIGNQLVPQAQTAEEFREGVRTYDTNYAVSNDGRVVLKHSTLMPVFSVPFYLVFGVAGFLIFNVAQLTLLIVLVAKLGGDTPASRWIALVALGTTPLLKYVFNYSPDLFGTLLLLSACCFAIHRRWFLAGLFAGLTIWAKVYLLVLVLPLALLVGPDRRAWSKVLLSAASGVLPMLLIQWHLFGSPFVTGYDRSAWVAEEGFHFADHYSRFNQPFFQGMWNLLGDGEIGMIITAPLWCVSIAVWAGKGPFDNFSRAMLMILVLNLTLFACYDEWNASIHGNRFLFPALVAGFILGAGSQQRAAGAEPDS
jgi:hypothetical protein